MEKNKVELYGKTVFGVRVSDYGLKHGYLDYWALARIVGPHVLNNSIFTATPYSEWTQLNGDEDYEEIYQYYVITEAGYEFLERFTDEIVFYNAKLDIRLWAITHYGTAWDYVLTDVELSRMDGETDVELVPAE